MTVLSGFQWGFDGSIQSMGIEGGRVLWRDARTDFPAGASIQDLSGKWLLPSFIDAHCHILPAGLFLSYLDLGACTGHDEVLDLVRDRHRAQPDGWLMAVNYDQNRYPGGHMHRSALDAIAPDRPVLLRHVSGHASVANSEALQRANVGPVTPNPGGGVFVRDESGELTGVLLEEAHDRVNMAVPNPSVEEMATAICLAGDSMAGFGIAAATDMMTGRYDLLSELDAYRLAAERGCRVRTRLFLQWKEVFGKRAPAWSEIEARLAGADPDRVRINGIKIFADGAIGSATAAIYGDYTSAVPEGSIVSRHARDAGGLAGPDVVTSGQLIYAPDKLKEMVRVAHDAGFEVAIHAIGDYAVDLVMDAFEATGEPDRHRLEHAMLLSDAQIERIARSGVRVTFQPEFLARFGYAYVRQLGPERAAMLKRTRSVLDAGIPLSFNSDRPIVEGDPWVGIHAAENRPSDFSPSENCTRTEALLAYTSGAALANRDDNQGTLLRGTLADYQVLPKDPLR